MSKLCIEVEKKSDENIIRSIRNLLKIKLENEGIKDRIIRDIRAFWIIRRKKLLKTIKSR